jgi:hypothetical protein
MNKYMMAIFFVYSISLINIYGNACSYDMDYSFKYIFLYKMDSSYFGDIYKQINEYDDLGLRRSFIIGLSPQIDTVNYVFDSVNNILSVQFNNGNRNDFYLNSNLYPDSSFIYNLEEIVDERIYRYGPDYIVEHNLTWGDYDSIVYTPDGRIEYHSADINDPLQLMFYCESVDSICNCYEDPDHNTLYSITYTSNERIDSIRSIYFDEVTIYFWSDDPLTIRAYKMSKMLGSDIYGIYNVLGRRINRKLKRYPFIYMPRNSKLPILFIFIPIC